MNLRLQGDPIDFPRALHKAVSMARIVLARASRPVIRASVRRGAASRRHVCDGPRPVFARSGPNGEGEASREQPQEGEEEAGTSFQTPRQPKRKAESTDAVSTFLTRRFGLAGGLAWVGVLAFGVISEQVKTRLEVKREFETTVEVGEGAKTITTGTGLSYKDVKVGGGQQPRRGDLVVVQYKAQVEGSNQAFEDTRKSTKAGAAFVFGSKPLPPGLPVGFEEALSTMRTGGKRIALVPPELGFGADPEFVTSKLRKGETVEIPANSRLTYEIELKRVSIPPS